MQSESSFFRFRFSFSSALSSSSRKTISQSSSLTQLQDVCCDVVREREQKEETAADCGVRMTGGKSPVFHSRLHMCRCECAGISGALLSHTIVLRLPQHFQLPVALSSSFLLHPSSRTHTHIARDVWRESYCRCRCVSRHRSSFSLNTTSSSSSSIVVVVATSYLSYYYSLCCFFHTTSP